MMSRVLCWAVSLLSLSLVVSAQQPNIVFIFMDDYGWNDIGYHGSEIMTPNMDRLAAEGVKLENYFAQPLCTPSRSQFLTGRYQIHTCMDSAPLGPAAIGGLPLEETTLANRLRSLGYATHNIGKWHLGYSSLDYVPTSRGFDTFYGAYQGQGDHFDHTLFNFIDLHDDIGESLEAVFTENGTYSSDLLSQRAIDIINSHDSSQPLFLYLNFQAVHTPLQAPQEYVDIYEDIFDDENRRILAGMATYTDESIASVEEALRTIGLWDNTVLILSSDNGGDIDQGSSNSPLRGEKNEYFNGGIQAVGFVSSPLLSQTGVEYTGLVHVSDWMPTLVNLAGGDVNDLDVDGFNVWDAISSNSASPRSEILHHIDPGTRLQGDNLYPEIFDVRVQASLTSGIWKIMTGNQGVRQENIFLFNLADDPNETTNVFQEFPDVVETMLERLAFYNSTAVPPCIPPGDVQGSNPNNNGGAWMPWL